MAEPSPLPGSEDAPRQKPKVIKLDRPEEKVNKLEIRTNSRLSLEEPETDNSSQKVEDIGSLKKGKTRPRILKIDGEKGSVKEIGDSHSRRKPKRRTKKGEQIPGLEPINEAEAGEHPHPKETRKFGKGYIGLTILVVVICALVFIGLKMEWMGENLPVVEEARANCLGIFPDLSWDYDLAELECSRGVLSKKQTLDDILLTRNIHWKKISELNRLAFLAIAPGLETGDRYTFLFPKADPLKPKLFAYEPDSMQVVFMNLDGESRVHVHQRSVLSNSIVTKSVQIQHDLAEVMFNQEFGLMLTEAMEKVLRWKVDFFHLSAGDHFTIAYEEKKLEGGITLMGKIRAIHFHTQGKDINAFYFQHGSLEGYYDEKARPLASSFLLAPVQYGRISSYYNLRRRDPLSKNGKIRAHLGTDYAAPLGTPIIAVADGIVEKAEFKGANGNYVKLIHGPEIKTQYLHMQGFADGIEPGRQVSQGDVIGYVGSTGRSTGPHVCFRYWKNGEQVNHLKEDFPSPAPIQGIYSNYFFENRDTMRAYLDGFF